MQMTLKWAYSDAQYSPNMWYLSLFMFFFLLTDSSVPLIPISPPHGVWQIWLYYRAAFPSVKRLAATKRPRHIQTVISYIRRDLLGISRRLFNGKRRIVTWPHFSLDPDLKPRANISSAPLHIYDLVAAQVCCRLASKLAPAAAFAPRLMVDQLACVVCRAQTAAKSSGPERCTLDFGSLNGVCSISIHPHFTRPAKT